MHWSVEEQTILLQLLPGDYHPHIESISLRVDDSSSHIMIMELRAEPDPDADPQVAGYVLRFDRNGALISSETIPIPPPPEPVSAASVVKS
jgi:hypothetical protein